MGMSSSTSAIRFCRSSPLRPGSCNRFRQPWTGLSDYRTWAVFLFSCTVALWWLFR